LDDLSLDLGLAHQAMWDSLPGNWLQQRVRDETGFTAAWAIQSRLAGITLLGLVALWSTWVALGAMLVWSLAATYFYFHARQRGAPDLANIRIACRLNGSKRRSLMNTATAVTRLWLVGPQAFLFTRLFARVSLARPVNCGRTRAIRLGGLALGLTFFGVTTTHHLLEAAGYSGDALLRLSCIASVLNVSYRVLVSALMMEAVAHLMAATTLF
jgi:hypothetical protein